MNAERLIATDLTMLDPVALQQFALDAQAALLAAAPVPPQAGEAVACDCPRDHRGQHIYVCTHATPAVPIAASEGDMARALQWVIEATEGDAGVSTHLLLVKEAFAAYDPERVGGATVGRQAAASPWRPISEAPLDGDSEVVCWDDGSIARAYFAGLEGWKALDDSHFTVQPTLYLPGGAP